jgi:hypothetical protein
VPTVEPTTSSPPRPISGSGRSPHSGRLT